MRPAGPEIEPVLKAPVSGFREWQRPLRTRHADQSVFNSKHGTLAARLAAACNPSLG